MRTPNVETLLHQEPTMTTHTITSRQFNQDTGGAKNAARNGPVYITDRGEPAHVLLTFEDYQRLIGSRDNIMELLAMPDGAEDIEFDVPVAADLARPAEFD
jgi:PHD/YefM family antitoxin component YafN of YafNO toxin-antitoxin module